LMAEPESRDRAKSLFKFSILYLMVLCTAMVVDSLPAVHQFDAQIWQVGQNFAQSISHFALGLIPQNF
jgi:heme o synthase